MEKMKKKHPRCEKRVDEYLSSTSIDMKGDPIPFWNNSNDYIHLCHCRQRNIWKISASSAPVELLCSISGRIFRAYRCSLRRYQRAEVGWMWEIIISYTFICFLTCQLLVASNIFYKAYKCVMSCKNKIKVKFVVNSFLKTDFIKEPRSSMCFFYPCHRVLADLTPGALDSVRSLSTRLFALQCH
jgi:hypothetical protein